MPPEAPHPAHARSRGFQLAALVLVVIALAVLAFGLLSRRSQAQALQARAEAATLRPVVVIPPGGGSAASTLELPGRIEAQSRAPIYARVPGYLKRWTVDIGTPVKAGQLLAEIETPDLDQQLAQARAELGTARANAALSETTAKRWQALLQRDAVSRQEADEKAADLAARQAAVRALEANVQRYEALKQFTRLVAPFDGVVTARNTDVGALINVGGAPGSELFVVSDLRKLRVYVNVPQTYTAAIRTGTQARVSVPEQPGRSWPATVQAVSRAVSSASGSMLVQLALDNAGADLLPGGFASVAFPQARPAGVLSVPPGALIYGQAGVRVAVVDGEDRIRLKPVTISRDLGAVVEIGSGLAASDRVVESPPDGVEEGDKVQVVATPVAPASAAGKR
ncbi:efflux RND transporter periplasmic adaptor subunit [Ramlibacter aquaticus]|uniref:Efflux RND transporter periplasmic adaptor subunit n=2 Tax=Comamonadaceae TaxID=80864 RepID=A0ABR9SKL8_9BURK|nr:efflux RND transporter periplasmic adaptor subunit [Ramlibacter aquaticus]